MELHVYHQLLLLWIWISQMLGRSPGAMVEIVKCRAWCFLVELPLSEESPQLSWINWWTYLSWLHWCHPGNSFCRTWRIAQGQTSFFLGDVFCAQLPNSTSALGIYSRWISGIIPVSLYYTQRMRGRGALQGSTGPIVWEISWATTIKRIFEPVLIAYKNHFWNRA